MEGGAYGQPLTLDISPWGKRAMTAKRHQNIKPLKIGRMKTGDTIIPSILF
jgi:hypothetical protein